MNDIFVAPVGNTQRWEELRNIALHILAQQLAKLEDERPSLCTLGPDELLFVHELFYCRAAQEGLAASVRDESALNSVEDYFVGRKLDDAVPFLDWVQDSQMRAIELGVLAGTSNGATPSRRELLQAELVICRHLAISTGRLRSIISQGKARTYPAQPLVLVEGLTSPLNDIAREQLARRSEWAGINGVGDCWGRAHGMTLEGAAQLAQTVGGKIDATLSWKGISADGSLLQSKRLQMSVMTASELAEELILANPKMSRRMAGRERQKGQPGEEDVGVWTDKSRQQFRSAARLMTKFLGSVPFVQAVHTDFVRFYSILLSLPVDHHTRRGDESLGLEQLAARAVHCEDGKKSGKLSLVTARRHLSNLRVLHAWLGTAFNLPIIQWEYLIARGGRDKIQDFLSVMDVEMIFDLPIWTGCKRHWGAPQTGDTVWHCAAYWVPILLWYSGIGRDGICALELDDVIQVGEHCCLRVRPGLGGVVEDRGFERLVPLHPEIIRLGFADYVNALRAEGETLLFPELRRASQQLAADVYSSRYWRPLKTALPEGKRNFGPGAIRDAAQRALKDLKVPEDKRMDLAGLRGKSQIDVCYSKVTPVEHLAVIVMKIPNVTGHIEAKPINLIPVEARAPSRARVVPRVQDRRDQEQALASVLEPRSTRRMGL